MTLKSRGTFQNERPLPQLLREQVGGNDLLAEENRNRATRRRAGSSGVTASTNLAELALRQSRDSTTGLSPSANEKFAQPFETHSSAITGAMH